MSVTTETRRAPSFKHLSSPNHKTFVLTAEQAAPATKKWFVVDADKQIVGRLATRIATILMGKHRPEYTAHVDSGDYVVVVNVERVRFSGRAMRTISLPLSPNRMRRPSLLQTSPRNRFFTIVNLPSRFAHFSLPFKGRVGVGMGSKSSLLPSSRITASQRSSTSR